MREMGGGLTEWSEREAAVWLRDKSATSVGCLPSLTLIVSEMQTVTQFMEQFCRERTEVLKKMDAATGPFRRRFLTPECKYWYSETLKESEAESILSVSEANGSAQVISSGCGTGGRRLRYSLKSSDEGWLLNEVEWECGICKGTGTRKGQPCRLCKGKGWVGGNR